METNKRINPLNIFNEGKIASGRSFIGRQDLLSKIMDLWDESGGNASRSVTGLNRMGKSSLIYKFCEVVKQKEPDAVCVILTLNQNTWPDLIQQIMKQILINAADDKKELDPLLKEICQSTCSIVSNSHNSLAEYDVMLNYKRLLDRMDKLGQKYLLIIDEFDGAKKCWANKGRYFEDLRDAMQKTGFNVIISRRPLEVIEMDSYGNSCFHNVFPEIHVCAFDTEKDMPAYYDVLEQNYGIRMDASEREKVEEYTGFCPALLTGLGHTLASAAIKGKPQPTVEEVFSEMSFQTNYLKHYAEFLKRMESDGLWDDLVRILMDISSIHSSPDSDDTYREAQIHTLCCKGYLRKKQNGEYVVFSDDFSSWAKHKLFCSEIHTIYDRIIGAEVSVREMLKQEMPKIWADKYPGRSWEYDFLHNSNVPVEIQFFTAVPPDKEFSLLQKYLQNARRYDPCAGVADALTIKGKLILIKKYWEDGIKDRFNSEPYSMWSNCFHIIENIRNPLFHATITPGTSSPQHYYLLKDANDNADRIIKQLS